MGTKLWGALAAGMFVLAGSAGAHAQTARDAEVDQRETRTVLAGEEIGERENEDVIPSEATVRPRPDLFMLEAGAGPSTFTGNLGNSLQGGVGYSVRGLLGAKTWLGLEVAYVGTANAGENAFRQNELDGPDVQGQSVYGNGAEALARFNLTPSGAPVRPFVAGGAGYFRLDSDAAVLDNLQSVSFPIEAGIQASPAHDVVVGLRGTYRILTDYIDNEFPTGEQYGGMLTLGATF